MVRNQFGDFIDLDPDWIRIRIHKMLWIQIRIHKILWIQIRIQLMRINISGTNNEVSKTSKHNKSK